MRALDLTNSPAIPSERLSCYRVFPYPHPLEIVQSKRFMARKIEVTPNDASDGTSHIPMDSLKAITTSLRRLKIGVGTRDFGRLRNRFSLNLTKQKTSKCIVSIQTGINP